MLETGDLMTDYRNVPELLEHYMDQRSPSGCWVTAREFRNFFHLDTSMTSTISGFFRRLSLGPYRSCPYIVVRIHKIVDHTPHPHRINRYYIRRRPITKFTVKESQQYWMDKGASAGKT